MSIEAELKCTRYMYFDSDESAIPPCQCPVCGGFLKWVNEKPICNKCGAELIVIPDHDEEDGTELETGKICPISLKKKVTTS